MHLFEFMDQKWLPKSLRDTLRDILECCNSRPFRGYYEWVAEEVAESARKNNFNYVVELGSGPAPITNHLLRNEKAKDLSFIVCDDNPDHEAYRVLEKKSQGRVKPIYKRINFANDQTWPEDCLLVFSATLHHLPRELRAKVIIRTSNRKNALMVFEPLQNNLASILYVFLALFPAMLVPLRFSHRGGTLRRALWCWLLPIAPLMFVWDGYVSCIRQWKLADWKVAIDEERSTISYEGLSQKVWIAPQKANYTTKDRVVIENDSLVVGAT